MAGRSIAKLVISMGLDAAGLVTDIDRRNKQITASMDKLRRNVDRIGKGFAIALGTGFTAAAVKAIEFEKAMAEVGTLLDDTSGIDATADSLKKLSVQFGQSPVTQAKALYQVISAGATDAATQTEVLTAANQLAVGGITDVATAADGLTSVFNAYAADGLSASEISDVLFATMRQGKTTIEELSQNIGSVATIASQTGVSFAELGAGIATVTSSGLSTAQAAEGLRGVLSAVLKQSNKTKAAAKELGIQFDVNRLQAVGLDGVLKDIANSGATEEQLSKLIGRVEGLTTFMAAAREGGEAWNKNLKATENAAGQTEKAVAKMSDTTAFKVAQAKSAFEVLSIEVGNNFLAAISDVAVGLVDHVGDIILWINRLVGAFKILGAIANAVGAILVGVGDAILQSFKALVLGVYESLKLVNDVATQTLTFNFAGALKAIEERGAKIGGIFDDAGERIANAGGFIAEGLGGITKTADEVATELNKLEGQLRKNTGGFDEFDEAVRVGERKIKALRDSVDRTWKSLEDFERTQGKAGKATKKFSDVVKEMEPRLKQIAKAWEDIDAELEKLIEEQTRYEKSLAEIEEAFNPIGKLVENFEQQVADLNRAKRKGTLTAEAYAQRLAFLGDALGEAAKASMKTADQIVTDADRMREATLEGIRQMTSAFGDMWTNILTGAENSFDGIRDAFSGLLASLLRAATTDKIQLQFEAAFGEGGKGLKSLDFKQLGLSFGAIAAAEFSDDVIQGLFGDSTTEKYVEIGKQIGTAVGAIIGSVIPGIGTALGAVLGSFAGAIDGLIFGKLFGRKFFADIGGTAIGRQANTSPEAQAFTTALGEIVGIYGRGGFGSFDDPNTPGGQIRQAIEAFDQAIFDVLSAVGASDELKTIIADLEQWRIQTRNAGTAVEDIIRSRFDVVMQSFTAEVQDFVSETESIEDQINRLSVALSAQKLFEGAPDLFGDRTLADFLSALEEMNDGLGDLGQTLQTVAQQLIEIGGLTQFLSEFAASDLEAEFNSFIEAQNRSIAEALTAVNDKLFDAVANFDGSIESLQEIAGLVATVREGEIQYLQQLDSIQKGLNANLDDLRAEILGLTAPELSTQEILDQADALIAQVGSATSVEDIAALEQQFSALIRSISPDDQVFRQFDILKLIDSFGAAANLNIEALRADALANAESTRDLVGQFLTDIGDPLTVLIASNERIAAGVEQIAAGDTFASEPDLVSVRPEESFGINDSDETRQAFADGFADISEAIRQGRTDDVQAFIQAIREAEFPITVVINDSQFVSGEA